MGILSHLFHLWVVEDNPGLNRDLKALLEIEVPGTVVSSALTITEAFSKLDDPQLPRLDLAILDLRLPEVPGAIKKIHPLLAKRVTDLGVPSILMSGYLGSEDVESFIRDRKLHDPPLKVISKRDSNYFDELRDTIREYFVRKTSASVEGRLASVFGNSRAMAPSESSGTAELMSLQRQIVDYWDYLLEETRTRVRKWFSVSEIGDGNRSIRLRLPGG